MEFFILSVILQVSSAMTVIQNLAEGEFATANFTVFASYTDGAVSASSNKGESVVASYNADRKMNPASTFKAVTTGSALMKLGKDYHWETSIAVSGQVKDSVLTGNLHIIGAGDPMLGSDDKGAQALDLTFREWERFLNCAGIKRIDGDIIADGSWAEGVREEPSWSYEDIGTYYGTCSSGLNFHENSIHFNVSAIGRNEGEQPSIGEMTPACPWMDFRFDCTVGKEGTGDRLYMFGSDLCEKAVIRGTYAAGKQGTLKCRNNYPERTLALAFRNHLKNDGMNVSGAAIGVTERSDSLSAHSMAGRLKVLGTTVSPTLSTVITRTNQDSNNLYAELLLRTLGFEASGHASAQEGLKAMEDILTGMGLGMNPTQIAACDGSGLSRKNLVSARWMCSFLNAMHQKCPDFDTYLKSLVRYSSRCYYKTGSFSGCRCLCGYLLPAKPSGKTMSFCIMVNNSEMKTSRIDALEKQVINALAK